MWTHLWKVKFHFLFHSNHGPFLTNTSTLLLRFNKCFFLISKTRRGNQHTQTSHYTLTTSSSKPKLKWLPVSLSYLWPLQETPLLGWVAFVHVYIAVPHWKCVSKEKPLNYVIGLNRPLTLCLVSLFPLFALPLLWVVIQPMAPRWFLGRNFLILYPEVYHLYISEILK